MTAPLPRTVERAIPPEPHVVIVGAGFAGLALAQGLGGTAARVTVVDRNNYHLFVPLLYQVATAALSPADVAAPIRSVLARYRNIEVILGAVTRVDTSARTIQLHSGERLGYDVLALATGSTANYFGHADWSRAAPSLKSIADARAIRTRVLSAFERAERAAPGARDALLTFIVVGGGPTGVELAGSVAELARHTLARDFRHVRPGSARVVLVEAGPRILAAFPDELADYAVRALGRLRVEVITGVPVAHIDSTGVWIDGNLLRAATVLWGAGVSPTPAAAMLGVGPARGGGVPVRPDLSVADVPGVFALGDIAHFPDASGKPLPGLAQVAQQQGEHLARALRKAMRHGTPLPPFQFKNRGNAAIIGRHAAVFDFGPGRPRLRGLPAWLLWALVHVLLLVDFDQRARVSLQWLSRYLTYRRGARIISDPEPATTQGAKMTESPNEQDPAPLEPAERSTTGNPPF
ncbi:MAG TPA: NAD(P)/FAD-dependent oxidoreductase, partial [Sphingomonas sp.]